MKTAPIFLSVVILLVDVVAFYQIRKVKEADASLINAVSVTNAVRDVYRLMTEAETGQRGFILTGRESYVEPYENSVRRMPAALNSLALLLGEDNEDVNVLRKLVRDKFEELEETIKLKRYKSGDDAVRVINSDRGRSLMIEARRTVISIQEEQEKVAINYTKELSKGLTTLSYVRGTNVVMLLLLIISLLFYWKRM